MAQQKRIALRKARTAPPKGRSPAQKNRATAEKGRTAARKIQGSRRNRRPALSQRQKAAEKRAFDLFDQQIGPMWDRLANDCRQFAEGFNQEMGADQLRVEMNPAGLMVRLTPDGAEAFFQLDRTSRHVSVAMSTGCTNFGSCITDQAPVGLAILDGQLRFLFNGAAVSEEELAVRILTDLLEADTPKPSR
jgi:hypothetical protein